MKAMTLIWINRRWAVETATGNMGIQGGRKGRDAEAVRDSPAVTRPLAAPEGLAVSPPDSESRESSSTWGRARDGRICG